MLGCSMLSAQEAFYTPEASRRRWIDKNSGLGASRRRWIDKNIGLELSGDGFGGGPSGVEANCRGGALRSLVLYYFYLFRIPVGEPRLLSCSVPSAQEAIYTPEAQGLSGFLESHERASPPLQNWKKGTKLCWRIRWRFCARF